MDASAFPFDDFLREEGSQDTLRRYLPFSFLSPPQPLLLSANGSYSRCFLGGGVYEGGGVMKVMVSV